MVPHNLRRGVSPMEEVQVTDKVRCPDCKKIISEVRIQEGQVVVRCSKCKKYCRVIVKMVPEIVVEIIPAKCNTPPAPA